MAGTGRTTRTSSGSYSVTDPSKKLASTANTDKKRTHEVKTTRGTTVDVRKKTVEDAKEGRGAFEAPKNYKGNTIKNKDGKMSGYKLHDGSYTRTSTDLDRKAAEKKIAYDKKLQTHNAAKKADRNKRFAEAKVKGTK